MRTLRQSLATMSLAALAACSSQPEVSSSVEGDTVNEGENVDIQLISAETSGNLTEGLSWLGCGISNKTSIGVNKFEARADCTDAASTKLNMPLLNRYVEPLLWLYENSSGVSYASRHWCAKSTILVAVKEAALNSPSFRAIGFFSYESTLNEGNSGTLLSFAKDDWRLQRAGEAHLLNGEKVVLFRFGGVGPCEVNGSGRNPGGTLRFKPFVTYAGGLRRWEAVAADHEVGYGQRIERRSSLLRD